jgi:signal transduction histidine kinase
MASALRQMRWQIAVAYTLLIVITLTGLALALYNLTRSTYLRTLEEGIVGHAYLIAALAESEPPGVGVGQLDALVDDVSTRLAARVTLIAPDGRMLADSLLPPERYTSRSDRPEVLEALQAGFGETQRYSTTTGDDRFYVAVPFRRDGAVAGVVRVGVPLATIARAQLELELVVVAAAVPAAVVAFGLAVLIAGRTTRSLQQLRGMAERMARGDLEVRVPVPPGEEVGALAQSFNQMAGRLQELGAAQASERERLATILAELQRAERSRRMLLANISHDLRTPVASLQALIDTLLDGAIDDPEAARDFLGRMDVEVQGLGQLVSEFLELSWIELGQVPIVPGPVDIAALLRAAAGRMEVQARQKGVPILVRDDGPLPLANVDRGRIEQVLMNLLQNALTYTPPGGRITMGAREQADSMLVEVRDTGVGIPPADVPHIFERFYKADPARSGGGVGLGLAIAKHLVERHGGRIWAESAPGAGTTVAFVLPLDGPADGEGAPAKQPALQGREDIQPDD